MIQRQQTIKLKTSLPDEVSLIWNGALQAQMTLRQPFRFYLKGD